MNPGLIAPLLITYAGCAGVLGHRLLTSARWTSRAPGLAVVLWQAIGTSMLLATAAAGLALALPAELLVHGVADFLNACLHTLRERSSTTAGALTVSAGLLLTMSVLARAAWGVASELLRARRCRGRQLADLRIACRRDDLMNAYVLDDKRTLAYCLPGRHRAVVITTAARTALTSSELTAVLQHERAHLRWRHDLVLSSAAGLRRAFPFLPALASAERACRALVEMMADDGAARRSGRRTVASALLRMASGDSPPFALAANGDGSAQRVYRMLDSPARLGVVRRTGTGLVAAALVLGPLAATATPALAAASGHCAFL